MTPEQLTEARKIADRLKDRYGCAVPTSQAAALLRRQADHIDAQAAEIERLRDELALCCQLKREYQEQAK